MAARPGFVAAVALVLAHAAQAGELRGTVQIEAGRAAAIVPAEAVVWVEGPRIAPPVSEAVVAMKDKLFTPRVVVVGVGSSVSFPNQDPVFHNVFSVSGRNRFDLGLYKRPKRGTYTFTHPGLVRVYCNIHPQMSAFVLVRDNPYWARPAADGSFSIPDLPPGSWTLRAWHERAGEISQPITVGDAMLSVALSLDASRYREAPHKNKHGRDYSSRSGY